VKRYCVVCWKRWVGNVGYWEGDGDDWGRIGV